MINNENLLGCSSWFANMLDLPDRDFEQVRTAIDALQKIALRVVQTIDTPEENQDRLVNQLAGLTAIARSRTDRSQLWQVAEQFDKAWPGNSQFVIASDKKQAHPVDEHLKAEQTSFGYLIARDIFERLSQTNVPKSAARIPILMVSEKSAGLRDGEIRELEIELRKDDCYSAFYPDPLCLGLTRISDPFFQSMQNVWKASGLAKLPVPVTGVWRIRNFPGLDLKIPDRQFDGRSIEAITLCAIWSANGKIPSHADEDFKDLAGLDYQSTVIGCIDNIAEILQASSVADPTKLRIGKVDVGGIQFKVGKVLEYNGQTAGNSDAKKIKIDRIFIAHDHQSELFGLINQCQDKIELQWAETLGPTMLKLLETFRIAEALQKNSVEKWDAEWYVPEEEQELAGDV